MRGRSGWLCGLSVPALMVCLLLPLPVIGAEGEGVGGVGIMLDMHNDATGQPAFVVRGLMEEMPAAEAGVKEDDRITHVDGAPLAGLLLAQVVGLIRGEAGTQVKLTLQREGEDDPIEVALERKQLGPAFAAVHQATRERLQAERGEHFERMAAEQGEAGARHFVIRGGQRLVQVMGAAGVVGPAGPPGPAGTPVQLQVAGDYVYVVRGYMLYQFKVEGLVLVAKHDLRTDEEK